MYLVVILKVLVGNAVKSNIIDCFDNGLSGDSSDCRLVL